MTVIVSVAAELVAGRGRGAAGLAVCGVAGGVVTGGGVWAGRDDSTGGVWAAASAARTRTPPTPADTVRRPVTRRAVAGRIMPVTYIDLRARRQREDANGRPRAGLFATSLASANRTGEKVVEVGAGIEAPVAQVTVDAAIDDAYHRGHLADVAAGCGPWRPWTTA